MNIAKIVLKKTNFALHALTLLKLQNLGTTYETKYSAIEKIRYFWSSVFKKLKVKAALHKFHFAHS